MESYRNYRGTSDVPISILMHCTWRRDVGRLSAIPFSGGIAFFACSYGANCYILCAHRGSAMHSLSTSANSHG